MHDDFPLTCEEPGCPTVVAFIRIVGSVAGRPIVRYRVTDACAVGPLAVLRCHCHSRSLAPAQPIPRPELPFPVCSRAAAPAPPQRRRGRPPKEKPREATPPVPTQPKRRGRPPKNRTPQDTPLPQPTRRHLLAEATENRTDLVITFRVWQDETILAEQQVGMADFLAQVRLVDQWTTYYRAGGYELAMNDRWRRLLS